MALSRASSSRRSTGPIEVRARHPLFPLADQIADKAVGSAVRQGHLFHFDHLTREGRRPEPGDDDFTAPLRVEPHHLVVWAGRWYFVAYDPGAAHWAVYRVDRIHPHTPTGVRFERRELPDGDVARYVMTRHDRGDTPARWQCLGTVVMDLPAAVVARWAPGGSVIEDVAPGRSRLTVGAWSWAGIAGILATFDATISDVEPQALRDAVRGLSQRFSQPG